MTNFAVIEMMKTRDFFCYTFVKRTMAVGAVVVAVLQGSSIMMSAWLELNLRPNHSV
jgi:hypothetical protein